MTFASPANEWALQLLLSVWQRPFLVSRVHMSLALAVLDTSTPLWPRRPAQASQKSISNFTKQVVRNYVPVLFYHNKNSQHNLVARVPRGSEAARRNSNPFNQCLHHKRITFCENSQNFPERPMRASRCLHSLQNFSSALTLGHIHTDIILCALCPENRCPGSCRRAPLPSITHVNMLPARAVSIAREFARGAGGKPTQADCLNAAKGDGQRSSSGRGKAGRGRCIKSACRRACLPHLLQTRRRVAHPDIGSLLRGELLHFVSDPLDLLLYLGHHPVA